MSVGILLKLAAAVIVKVKSRSVAVRKDPETTFAEYYYSKSAIMTPLLGKVIWQQIVNMSKAM